jgi:hypothetical protein
VMVLKPGTRHDGGRGADFKDSLTNHPRLPRRLGGARLVATVLKLACRACVGTGTGTGGLRWSTGACVNQRGHHPGGLAGIVKMNGAAALIFLLAASHWIGSADWAVAAPSSGGVRSHAPGGLADAAGRVPGPARRTAQRFCHRHRLMWRYGSWQQRCRTCSMLKNSIWSCPTRAASGTRALVRMLLGTDVKCCSARRDAVPLVMKSAQAGAAYDGN